MWRGLKNRSDTYSFALWAPRTPFAYMPLLIYFGVGSREGEPYMEVTEKGTTIFSMTLECEWQAKTYRLPSAVWFCSESL